MVCYNLYNFFFGFLIQVAPCAFLCIFPLWNPSTEEQALLNKRTLLQFVLVLFVGALTFALISARVVILEIDEHVLTPRTANGFINLLFVGFVLLFFVFYAFRVQLDLRRKTFLFLYAFEYGMSLAVTSIIFTALVESNEWTQYGIPYSDKCILFLVASNALLCPLFAIVLRPLFKLTGYIARKSDWLSNSFFLIPLPFIICTLLCSIFSDDPLLTDPLFILLLAALIGAELTLYWIISQYIFSTMQSAEQDRQYQMTLDNYQTLAKNIESLRFFRHDFNRYLFTIASYIESNDSAGAIDYIHTLQKSPSLSAPLAYSKHALINSMLLYFLSDVNDAGIPIDCRVDVPTTLPISDDHLIGILYNLLQNASEACIGAKADPEYKGAHFLYLNIYIRQDHLIILCNNSSNHPLQKSNTGQIISSKKDAHKHGFGLKIIESIVQMHDGMMDYHALPDKFEMTIALHLSYPDYPIVNKEDTHET